MTLTCGLCGRSERDPARALSWSHAVEAGRERHVCGSCTRQHLRAAEARLDSEHW